MGGTYDTNSQIKIKTSILKSILCNYNDAYKILSRTITVPNTCTAAVSNNKKNLIIKNRAQLTDCISEINNTQIDKTLT